MEEDFKGEGSGTAVITCAPQEVRAQGVAGVAAMVAWGGQHHEGLNDE